MKLHPRLRAEGVLLARRSERFRAEAEPDARGWVVGYGHRASAREGARVTEADALALLTYDLSQSAAHVEPLLRHPVSPALFDALNACAFRIGPERFARSDVLRRVDAGEVVDASEVTFDGEPATAPLAVSAAADAVRDRLSQLLSEPEPEPSPRPRREPWREPGAPRDAEPRLAPRTFPDTGGEAPSPFPPSVAPPEPEARRTAGDPFETGASTDAEDGSVPPLPSAAVAAALASPAPPVVSFERGGRARLWVRLRADPIVYVGIGGLGAVLFALALVGFLVGRPSALGLVLGLAGVLCLAPAVAFFLHRRSAR